MGVELEAEAGLKFEICDKDDVANAIRESLRDHAETIWEGASGKTGNNGNLSLEVYKVPAGKRLILERVILWADGFTPASPSSVGWIGIFHGPGQNIGQLADFQPQTSGAQVFPGLAEYNHNNAPRFKGGESMYAEFFAVVASTNVSVLFQGKLVPEGHFKKFGL